MPEALQIETFQIGSMRNFVYVVSSAGQACLIDPHKGLDPVAHYLERERLLLTHVLLTHSHHDHVSGLEESFERFAGAPNRLTLALHALELHRINKSVAKHHWQLRLIDEADEIQIGAATLTAMHTPGHTAGEICYHVGDHLFTGDTLFMGNVGRTDLPTGNTAQLFESLMRIAKMPGQTVLHPGHDYGTSPTNLLANERETNPGLLVHSVKELEDLP